MSATPSEAELTAAALAVAGASDVFPPPSVLSDPPETLAALLRRDLAALAQVDLAEGPVATVRLGVDAATPAAATGCAVADAIAARFGDAEPVSVVVRITRIS